MEAYKILVANSQNQKSYSFETTATTRGELKEALRANNIPFEGMSFTEGISKVELLEDNSVLPVNTREVNYKGQAYKMILLLTNSKKNIASGIGTRLEAYQTINEANLKEDVKEFFGRNYTQIPTADLWKFIDDRFEKEEDTDEEDEYEDEEYEDEENTEEDNLPSSATANTIVEAFTVVIRDLLSTKTLVPEDVHILIDDLYETLDEIRTQEEPVSPAAIPDSNFDDIASLV